MKSPRVARALLRRTLPADVCDAILGDLEELYCARAEEGSARARLWYWKETLSLATLFLVERLRDARATVFCRGSLRRVPGAGVALEVKLGARMLVKYPGLTIVGGLAIAASIATGAAWFEFVRDYNGGSVPLPEGDRIVGILTVDAQSYGVEQRVLDDFLVWRDELTTVEHLGAFDQSARMLDTGDGLLQPVMFAEISASAFDLVRIAPQLGRPLQASDERADAAPVMVIGHEIWQRRFRGDPNVVGRSVKLGNTMTTVVGVMPPGFAFPVRHSVWLPQRFNIAQDASGPGPVLHVFGRLADGVTLEEAQAQLTAIGARATADRPDTHARLRPLIKPYARSFRWSDENWMHAVNLFFILLLLVSCATVGTLVFARTVTRENEIAVRSALGASRARIVTQLFIEALVLAIVAAIAGVAVLSVCARAAMRLYWSADQSAPPFWWDNRISLITLLYAFGLAGLGGAVAGVFPALKMTRGINGALRRATSGGSSLRFGGVTTAVVVIQVGLSTAALPGAVYIANGVIQAHANAIAFDGDRYLTALLVLDAERTTKADSAALAERAIRFGIVQNEIERRLMREPSVAAVTWTTALPGTDHAQVYVEVDEAGDEFGRRLVREAMVDTAFFAAMNAAVLQGRSFRGTDLEGADVAIVNESFVRDVLGNRNAVGRRVRVTVPWPVSGPGPWREIIGVVPDLGMNVDPKAQSGIYLPLRRDYAGARQVAMRVRGEPESMAAPLREIARAVDPGLWVLDVETLTERGRQQRAVFNAVSALAIALVSISLLLALAGTYALMAFTVARRTREIGIRVALGAERRRIISDIFSRALLQLGLGVTAGAMVGASITESYISVEGPALLMLACVIILLVGLAACSVPAARALRITPTEALREG